MRPMSKVRTRIRGSPSARSDSTRRIRPRAEAARSKISGEACEATGLVYTGRGLGYRPDSTIDFAVGESLSPRSRPRPQPVVQRKDLVLLDGLSVRRRRHARGWSPRELVLAIESASVYSSGRKRSLSPSQIEAIEERAERIPYELVLLLADGLDCDPVDLIAEGELSSKRSGRRLH